MVLPAILHSCWGLTWAYFWKVMMVIVGISRILGFSWLSKVCLQGVFGRFSKVGLLLQEDSRSLGNLLRRATLEQFIFFTKA